MLVMIIRHLAKLKTVNTERQVSKTKGDRRSDHIPYCSNQNLFNDFLVQPTACDFGFGSSHRIRSLLHKIASFCF